MATAKTDTAAGGEALTITRVFDAPRELVFDAWTNPDRLKDWFGPAGFTMLSCSGEFRPGGVFHYGMRAPNGMEMWGKWTIREIVRPERLVIVASFSDAAQGETRHPFAANWPLKVLSTSTFSETGGKTTMTMSSVPLDATEGEQAAFVAGFDSMRQGWKGTLEQLDAYLAKA